MRRLSLILVGILFLAGCGDSNNDYNFPLLPEQTTATTYRLGVLAPLKAGQTEFGLGIRNSAQLAVNQWNQGHLPNGPFFELVAADDSSDPATGLNAAQRMVQLDDLCGVVGTYNSGVAAAVLPTFEQAGVAMISPGNTDPTLTLGPDLQHPVRPYSNYFRLVVPDTVQGPALAEYAFNQLGITKAAVLTEAKSVSKNLADAFSQKFQELGGTITTTQIASAGTVDYSGLLDVIAPTNPELLFYAGEVPNASTVRRQATQAGITVAMMGGDGMKAQSYIDEAGVATAGDIASSLGVPADLLPTAASFLTAYQSAKFTQPASDFGPYAYDAANLLMAATVASKGDSAKIISFLSLVNSQGATGALSFDNFGDTNNKVLTINVVQDGAFLPDEIVTVH